ncbi:hypothetical protein BM1_01924 [Bipolaris maydis]|nr:hypothetical protein BM1_01924 [Bipolaris maydis]
MKFTNAVVAFNVAALINALAISSRQNNIQTFTGALGGKAATPVLNSGNADRPFSVGGDTFVNAGAALQRSCDQQFNACANLANGGDASISVADCTTQKNQCTAQDTAGAAQAQGAAQAGGQNNNAQNNNAQNNNAQNADTGNAANGNAATGAAQNNNGAQNNVACNGAQAGAANGAAQNNRRTQKARKA